MEISFQTIYDWYKFYKNRYVLLFIGVIFGILDKDLLSSEDTSGIFERMGRRENLVLIFLRKMLIKPPFQIFISTLFISDKIVSLSP